MYYTKQVEKIQQVIQNYFEGIFYGDIDKLKGSFIEQAILYGDVNGVEYRKSLGDYLEGVKTRKSPKELQEVFKMKILGIEILGNNAIVKVHVPMLGYNYYDILSLSIVNEEWKIVNKIFSHVE